MSRFSDMLAYLRKREKLSQTELAARLGLSRSTVAMYEKGVREPKFETLEAIADIFNVDLNTLVGGAAELEKIKSQEEDRLDPELSEMMQRARDDPHIRMLFSVAQDCTPEALDKAIKIIQMLKSE